MKHILITAALATGIAATPAFAAADKKIDGRSNPLTKEAQTKLGVAMKDAGCEGGDAVQDGEYVSVTGTTCGNRSYNLTFDRDFKVTQKEEAK